MPRLREITSKQDLPEDKQSVLDYLAETRGSVRVPFSIVLNSPEACARIAHLGTYLRFESSLPPQVTELATLTVARHFDCEHEWLQHSRLAREAGVDEAALAAIANRRDLASLKDDQALPVRYAREILEGHAVSAETFAAAQRRFGAEGVIDLTATVGYYSLMACLLNALEIVPEGGPHLP